MRHLHIHKNEVKRPSIPARALQRIDRLEAVEVRVALEAESLHETDGDALIDRVVLCNTNPELVARDRGQVDTRPRLRLVAVVFLRGEFRHWVRVARVLAVAGLGFGDFLEAQGEGDGCANTLEEKISRCSQCRIGIPWRRIDILYHVSDSHETRRKNLPGVDVNQTFPPITFSISALQILSPSPVPP
jgi:hypothetical protein